MSQTFMRGLEIIQFVDLHGPVSMADISRAFGVDKGSVSRLVAAAEVDGWLERSPAGVIVGPRSALLGDTTPTAQALADAGPLLDAVSGATGLVAQALILAGGRAVGVAVSGPRNKHVEAYMRRPRFPLWAGAGGKVIAAQLGDADLDRVLPPDPFPGQDAEAPFWADQAMRRDILDDVITPTQIARRTRVTTRSELDAQLVGIRSSGLFREFSEMDDALGCIAVAWPHYSTPASLAVVGDLEEIEAKHLVIERALRAAAARSADRDDVTRAAAAALAE